MNAIQKIGVLLGALGVVTFTASAGSSRRSLTDHEIVKDQELLITAVEVVDSPLASYPGPWSFGHLMEQAFGKEEARAATVEWLSQWSLGKDSEGGKPGVLPPREELWPLVTGPWQKRDGYDSYSGEEWIPNFANAPFRLLAIVNRMDLSQPMASFLDPSPTRPRSGAHYYSSGPRFDSSGGEGRLVFGVIDESGQPLKGGVTLIFEYGIDTNAKTERLYDWAMAWHSLGNHEIFDAAYLGELAQVTRAFTDRVVSPKGKNHAETLHERLQAREGNTPTSLMRIRTNDGAFGETREFREFAVGEKRLTVATMGGSPRKEFFEVRTPENRWLARWLRDQRGKEVTPSTARDIPGAVLPETFALPLEARMNGRNVPVLARVSPVVGNGADYHWDSKGFSDSTTRRAFSMQTCCGCHCGDTNTAFFHIAPRPSGEVTLLSNYLRTDGSRWKAKDPRSKRGVESAEMDDRMQIVESILTPDLRPSQISRIRERRSGRGH